MLGYAGGLNKEVKREVQTNNFQKPIQTIPDEFNNALTRYYTDFIKLLIRKKVNTGKCKRKRFKPRYFYRVKTSFQQR